MSNRRHASRSDADLDLQKHFPPPASGSVNPIDIGSRVGTAYPDELTALVRDRTMALHYQAQCVARARALHLDAQNMLYSGLSELEELAGSVEVQAFAQATRHAKLRKHANRAERRREKAHKALNFKVKFPRFNPRWLLLGLLLVGDMAAGTLALANQAGDNPVLAAVFMAAVASGVVTMGKTAEVARRDHFRRSIHWDDLSPKKRKILQDVFGETEESWLFARVALIIFAVLAVAAPLGATILRLTEASATVPAGFGFWSLVVAAGSFANGWVTCDPAAEALTRVDDDAELANADADTAPLDAVASYDATVAAIRRIGPAWAAEADRRFNTELAGAGAYMVANPALVGHGEDGAIDDHSLLQVTAPTFELPDVSRWQMTSERNSDQPAVLREVS